MVADKTYRPEDLPPLRTVWPPLRLEDHPIDEVRSLRVIVVGGGISGILAAILLPAKVPQIDLQVYERQEELGGVWNSNVYPGVRCDVPAHAYQATFAPSADWTEAYATGSEIKRYWLAVAEHYGVRPRVKLRHRVLEAKWSETDGKWKVKVEQPCGEILEDEADFVVTATGHFSEPRLPAYPGIESYKGHLRHSSNWDPAFDPTDKRIAVIGNGASGIQVLPPLQRVARRIDHYARSPTWVASPIGGDDLAAFVADRIENARKSPEAYLQLRKDVEARFVRGFTTIFAGSTQNKAARESITAAMKRRLKNNPDLIEALVPSFAPTCRRLTPGPGYLEALTEDNVELIRTPIERFTETGIITVDGKQRDVDAVICSTGHDTSFSTAFPIFNGHGKNLQESWRPGGEPGFPDSYLAIAAPRFPNLFLVLGPNASGPGGTLCHALETQLTYIAKVLRKVSSQGIRSLVPTDAAVRDFRAYCESFFPRTTMQSDAQACSSWYNGGIPGGRIHGLWPGSGWHANLARREPRWEDYAYTYNNAQENRFAYFGNGWSRRDIAVARGEAVGLDLTPWLRPEALEKKVDLARYLEEWWGDLGIDEGKEDQDKKEEKDGKEKKESTKVIACKL